MSYGIAFVRFSFMKTSIEIPSAVSHSSLLHRLSIIVSVDFLIFYISFWCTLPVIHKHK